MTPINEGMQAVCSSKCKPTQERQAEGLVHWHLDRNPNIEGARDAGHCLHAQEPHHSLLHIIERLVTNAASGGSLAALQGCTCASCQYQVTGQSGVQFARIISYITTLR